jgi:peptide/nickel transport system substrate-binding protein
VPREWSAEGSFDCAPTGGVAVPLRMTVCGSWWRQWGLAGLKTGHYIFCGSGQGWRRAIVFALIIALGGCGSRVSHDPSAVTFLIESGPANLDPRFAVDGQSQRIVGLLFSGLVERDEQMNLRGDLAASWENPDPLTYVFHLQPGIKFHDGRLLTSADVKATFDFMLKAENRSPKRGAFRLVESVEAPDPNTIIFRLKEPYASFVWNLARPAIGIVPADTGADFSQRLIGTGPFKFVEQSQDDFVEIERNADYFRGEKDGERITTGATEVSTQSPQRRVQKVTFRVVPDAVTRALELRKGSGDVEMTSLSPDMIPVLAKDKGLMVSERAGTNLAYIGINVDDAILAHKEVRQALAYATDRELLIKYLLHGEARLATGMLPPNHWAYEPDVRLYGYDLAQAERLLDATGFTRKSDGMRFRLTLKVSTDEQARLLGAALQDQWKKAGIDLEVRPLEIATLFADLAKGNFQLSYSKWIGANNDPDIFSYVFSSKRFPPDGANRGHYRNARMDLLTDEIGREMEIVKRKALCGEAQKIAAEDLPTIPLWYSDVVSVHRRSLGELELTATGDYEFLGKE